MELGTNNIAYPFSASGIMNHEPFRTNYCTNLSVFDEASRDKSERERRGSCKTEAAASRHGAVYQARCLHERRPTAGYRRVDRGSGTL